MKKKWILIFVVIIAAIAFGLLYIMKSSIPVNFCMSDSDCYLNLCGCKCYTQGFGPKGLCGVNCLQWYNVSGCKCISNGCVEIP